MSRPQVGVAPDGGLQVRHRLRRRRRHREAAAAAAAALSKARPKRVSRRPAWNLLSRVRGLRGIRSARSEAWRARARTSSPAVGQTSTRPPAAARPAARAGGGGSLRRGRAPTAATTTSAAAPPARYHPVSVSTRRCRSRRVAGPSARARRRRRPRGRRSRRRAARRTRPAGTGAPRESHASACGRPWRSSWRPWLCACLVARQVWVRR